MQYTYREIRSLGEDLGEDYTEEKRVKLHKDQYRVGYQNRAEQQGLERDPNIMDVNRGRERDKMYFVYRKQDHIAKNYWQRKKRKKRIVKMPQEPAKDNREQ